MSIEHYIPYRVAPGETVETLIQQFQKDREQTVAKRDALFKKYGAKNGWGSDRGLTALVFEGSPPAGWQNHKGIAHRPPKGTAGKEIRKELAASTILGASDFSNLVACGPTMGMSGGGFCIRYAFYQKLGETYVILVPDDNKSWSYPGCTEMKLSEYFALKEAAGEGVEA